MGSLEFCASAPASVREWGSIRSPFVRDIRSCSPFMTAQWRMPSCGVEALPKYTERHRMWRPYYYTEIHVIDKALTPRMVATLTLARTHGGEREERAADLGSAVRGAISRRRLW